MYQLKQKQAEFNDKFAQLQSAQNRNIKQKKDDLSDLERREKELDDLLKEKLLDLMLGNAERGKDESTGLIIQSVMVRYAPDLSDGDIDQFNKLDPREACFRISDSTTFQQLKETACEFWVPFI